MLDIIAMVLLTMYNGRIAQKKGLNGGTWRLYTVVAWVVGEIIGTLVALLFFTPSDFINPKVSLKVSLLVIPFAFAGFHFVNYLLEKRTNESTNHS
ncbi:MAG: hypothetical protein IT215_05150 [Chitinophagaceae bacterium]|nr:MAG: hypothetical protein UZ11_BCD004000378 [Bacteroidetes bacterium OLB11]MCC6448054.1 hypothetical protein [Chitinophagaceae bacterium]HMN32917.1 hypothetical protein [Chitinophagaceae bacterium]